MKVRITMSQIDSSYDAKYAKEYHDGEESHGNRKYHWRRTSEVANVKEIIHLENVDTSFKMKHELGHETTVDFRNLRICRCITVEGDQIDFAVSESLLDKTHQAENAKYDTTR